MLPRFSRHANISALLLLEKHTLKIVGPFRHDDIFWGRCLLLHILL